MTSCGAVLIGVDVGGTTMSGGLVTPAGDLFGVRAGGENRSATCLEG
jgi:hypothetical protein